MSLKQNVVLWVSGTLTAFTIMGIFWTVFRSELDAARSLVVKANAIFEQIDQTLKRVDETSQRLEGTVQSRLYEFQNETRKTLAMFDELIRKTNEVVLRIEPTFQATLAMVRVLHEIVPQDHYRLASVDHAIQELGQAIDRIHEQLNRQVESFNTITQHLQAVQEQLRKE